MIILEQISTHDIRTCYVELSCNNIALQHITLQCIVHHTKLQFMALRLLILHHITLY